MKIKPKKMYAYLLGLTSTFYIMMLHGIPVFYFIALAGLLLFGIKKAKVDPLLIGYTLCMVISSFFNFFTSSYRGTIIFTLGLFAILLLSIIQFEKTMYDYMSDFMRGLRHSCYCELIWCFIQYGFDKFFSMDINTILFVEKLHTVQRASRFLNGKLVLSGFCWHPSNMIPIILLLLLFSNNLFVWFACFFVVIHMQSSTALMIVALAIITRFSVQMFDKYANALTFQRIFTIFGGIIAAVTVAVTSGIGNTIITNFIRLYNRLIGVQNDLSTIAHKSYYVLYPQVWQHSSIIQKLFGYGPGLSGIPITNINGQYASLGSWVVESDVMNYVYGIGLIGAVIVYAYFLRLLIKSKQDRSILICMMIPLLFAGITYNIQYYWVFFCESLLVICKANNYSIRSFFEKTNKRKIVFRFGSRR